MSSNPQTKQLTAKADRFYQSGNIAKAEQTYQEGEASVSSREVANQYAMFMGKRGRLNAGLKKLNEVKNASEVMRTISIRYTGQIKRMQGDLEAAEEYFKEALAEAERLEEPILRAELLADLGNICRNLQRSEEATAYLDEAIEEMEPLGDREGLAKVYSAMANLLMTKHQFDQAEDYLQKALRQNREIERTEGIAVNLNNLGNLHRLRKDYDTAAKYYREAIEKEELLERQEPLANALLNMAATCDETDDPEGGRPFVLRARKIYSELENNRMLAICDDLIEAMR